MKLQTTRPQVGIWLDHTNAWLIEIDNGKTAISSIISDVEPKAKSKGGRYSVGPHHAIGGGGKEKNTRERRDQEKKKFYKSILSRVVNADQVLVFGPGKAKTEFKKIAEEKKSIAKKLQKVLPAEKMTKNQMLAFVRNYFENA